MSTTGEILMGLGAPQPIRRGWDQRHIPLEMQERAQWIGYRLTWTPGKLKPDKVPVDLRTGGKPFWSNPATWCDWDQSIAGRLQFGCKPGFVLTAADPLVCIDFDDCRNKDTGEIDPDAWREVRKLHSYTEVSISGTGLHVFATGSMPGTRCQAPKTEQLCSVEMYEQGRGVLVTGRWLHGTCGVIMPAGVAIIDLYNRRLKPLEAKVSKYQSTGPGESDWSRGRAFGEGQRNYELFRLASAMRAKGLGNDDLATELSRANQARCQPPLSEHEVSNIARSACRYPPGVSNG